MNKGYEELSILDLISLLEIYRSRQKEKESDEFTNELIKALAYEVEQLHKENDKIIEQNNEILRRLKYGFYGQQKTIL